MVINTIFVWYFVDFDTEIEISFEKEQTAEQGSSDFEIGG